MRLVHGLLLAGAMMMVGGCYKVQYLQSTGTPPAAPSDEGFQIFILGLVPIDDPIALDQVCPSGWAKVETEMGIVPYIVSSVTGGLIGLRDYRVYCETSAGMYRLDVNEEGYVTAAEKVEG